MNDTIKHLLNHKTIRKFKNQPLTGEQVSILVTVAQHTATSSFMQAYSIISIRDKSKQKIIAEICDQHYVAEAGHLFIMVADQQRNDQIAHANGQETSVLHTADRFLSAITDTCLAAQNMMVAAESMGLSGVFLGSILNDSEKMIQLLNLPPLTFPILGIAFGYADQEPQLKPRMPQMNMHFENTYQTSDNILQDLKDYDEIVTEYYDLRDANRRIDSFTKQITDGMNRRPAHRMDLLNQLHEQDWLKL